MKSRDPSIRHATDHGTHPDVSKPPSQAERMSSASASAQSGVPSAVEILSRAFRPLDVPSVEPRGQLDHSGVYLLVLGGAIIYVGASTRVLFRVWQQRYTRRLAKRFSSALWYPLPAIVLPHYEGAFIRKLDPVLNKRAPLYLGHDNEILEGFGLEPHQDVAAVVMLWRNRLGRLTHKERFGVGRQRRTVIA